MKAVFKVMLAAVSAALCLASCGFDAGKMEGDWTISTVNGRTPEDFAAYSGVGEWCVAKNYKIDGKTLTISAMNEKGDIVSQDYAITERSGGIDASAAGVTLGLYYNEDDNSIKYSIKYGDTQYTYILKRGTVDISGMLEAGSAGQTEEKKQENDSPEI